MKHKITILVCIMFLVTIIVFYIRISQKASIIVTNQAGESLKIISIELCGESATIKNLPVWTSKKLELKVQRDCHYQVEAIFDSGKTLNNSVGYVTNGLQVEDQIIITDSEIKMGAPEAP